MVKVTLTADQSAEIEPLIHQAYDSGGAVFCQCQRGTFPDYEQIFIGCHFLPAESSKRLRAFLKKERARIDKTARAGIATLTGEEEAV